MTKYEISASKYGEDHAFVIYATEGDISLLRAKLDKMNGADMQTYIRAHIPFKPYHEDSANDLHDESFTEAYQMIYQLGDETTKEEIRSLGVLGDARLE